MFHEAIPTTYIVVNALCRTMVRVRGPRAGFVQFLTWLPRLSLYTQASLVATINDLLGEVALVLGEFLLPHHTNRSLTALSLYRM